jgi:UDP-N-acetylglucosamine 2-epimerase
MRYAAIMLGNSSSGIVEAGLFGLPVIDVGGRQEGRVRGANVHHCHSDASSITRLLNAIGDSVEQPRGPVLNLYGDGRAAPRIATAVGDALADRERLVTKRFSEETGFFVTPWKLAAA